jgi:hypothetical protein
MVARTTPPRLGGAPLSFDVLLVRELSLSPPLPRQASSARAAAPMVKAAPDVSTRRRPMRPPARRFR